MSKTTVQPVIHTEVNYGVITSVKEGEYILSIQPSDKKGRWHAHLTLTRVDACPTNTFDFSSPSDKPEVVLKAFFFNALLRPFCQNNPARNAPLIETLVAGRDKANDGKTFTFNDGGVDYSLEYVSPYKVKLYRFRDGTTEPIVEEVRLKHLTKSFLRNFLKAD